MHTHAYMYTYGPQQMYTHSYIKIKKRKIVTRSNSTGFKECPDLWSKGEGGIMMVIWLTDALVLVLRGF